jgi:hypothetical protein
MIIAFKKILAMTILNIIAPQIACICEVKRNASTSFWYDMGYLLGVICKGLVVFATEGGQCASLTTH